MCAAYYLGELNVLHPFREENVPRGWTILSALPLC
jgi:hypothetical protein